MVIIDPFFPSTAIVTVDGTVVTTKIFSFSESGGTRSYDFQKTLGRRFQKGPMQGKEMYRITFDSTPTDSTIYDIWTSGSASDANVTVSIALTNDTGSYIITYSNARIEDLTHEMDSEDRLINVFEILVPPYDDNGADNRVVTFS